MSDSDNSAFTNFGKFVPGFDFLQNLATQAAGSATEKTSQLPNLGSWVAPTLNVEDLEKRIQELKSVQFWLDQNATALKATIQALEVQKMTLATLKGMNFNMGDVANAFKLKVADSVAGGVQAMADKAKTFAGLEVPPTNFGRQDVPAKARTKAEEPKEEQKEEVEAKAETRVDAPAAGVVDPMQWWGALTQQFQSIAADAMKDAAKKSTIDSTKNMATGLAKDAMDTATGMAREMAKDMAEGLSSNAGKTFAEAGRTAMNAAKNSVFSSAQDWPTPVTAKKPAAKKTVAKPARKTKP